MPNGDYRFYPYGRVLDGQCVTGSATTHGPHDAKLYKLWDELGKECQRLMAKGITGTGQGFDLPGRHLGGFSKKPLISSLRQIALAAAERRAVLGSLLPSGPRRLGGDSSIMVLSPAQAAAMAAERRLQDDIWCGSQFEDGGDKESNSHNLQNIENEKSLQNRGMIMQEAKLQRIRESIEGLVSQSSSSDVDQNHVDLTGMMGHVGPQMI